jgi:hypothetical protein
LDFREGILEHLWGPLTAPHFQDVGSLLAALNQEAKDGLVTAFKGTIRKYFKSVGGSSLRSGPMTCTPIFRVNVPLSEALKKRSMHHSVRVCMNFSWIFRSNFQQIII